MMANADQHRVSAVKVSLLRLVPVSIAKMERVDLNRLVLIVSVLSVLSVTVPNARTNRLEVNLNVITDSIQPINSKYIVSSTKTRQNPFV